MKPSFPSCIFLLAIIGTSVLVNAQKAEVCESEIVYKYDSGYTKLASTTVQHEGAPWIQLDLSLTNLAPNAQLVLTGSSSTETLTADTLASGNGWSSVLAGGSVQVELLFGNLIRGGDGGSGSGNRSRVAITGIKTGLCDSQPPASICGATDDRTSSEDVRVGRMGGCTAWLISEDVFLQAGHCGTPSTSTRVHFTYGTGNALSQDQYAVDVETYRSSDDGTGHDFGIGRFLPNGVTGKLPGLAQSEKCGGGGCGWYRLGAVPASTSGVTMRVTGFGTAEVESRSQKTHTGALTAIASNGNDYYLQYALDTTGGNSGSPAINDNTGEAIGIHTHGGCSTTGGANLGTRIDHPELQTLINSYLSTCTTDADCDDNDPSNVLGTCVNGRCIYPTPAPTPAPTPPCDDNTYFEVNIVTDNYPGETSYTVVDTCTNTVVVDVTAGTFKSRGATYSDSYCVSAGSAFDFTIRDTYGDGICCGYGEGSYSIAYEDSLHEGTGNFGSEETVSIGTCGGGPQPTTKNPTRSPTDAPVTASPTKAPTDAPVTASPTKAPTDPPVASPPGNCVNDPNWTYTNKKGKVKTCNPWVERKPAARCSKKGDDGRTALEACPEFCDSSCL